MYEAFSEFLVRLSGQGALWAVSVILAMAITAVVLYVFWDLVGRGVSLVRPGGRDRNISGGGPPPADRGH